MFRLSKNITVIFRGKLKLRVQTKGGRHTGLPRSHMVDGLTLTSEMQDDSFTPELPAFLSAVKTCVFNF